MGATKNEHIQKAEDCAGRYKRCPAAANDEALLLEQVWIYEGWSQSRSLYDNLCRVTRPETISRRKRELHNMGLIKYSEERETEIMSAYKNEVNMHSHYENTDVIKR